MFFDRRKSFNHASSSTFFPAKATLGTSLLKNTRQSSSFSKVRVDEVNLDECLYKRMFVFINECFYKRANMMETSEVLHSIIRYQFLLFLINSKQAIIIKTKNWFVLASIWNTFKVNNKGTKTARKDSWSFCILWHLLLSCLYCC